MIDPRLKELSSHVTPFAFVRYLQANGWVALDQKREGIAVCKYHNGEQFEQVSIPLDSTLHDYALAMYLAVRDVADLEGRPIEHVVRTLLNTNADILIIRIDAPGIELGSIPFDAGVSLYANFRSLITSSVQDVLHLGNGLEDCTEDAVQLFVRQCRFGQAERGDGYIVPLLCPFLDTTDGTPFEHSAIFNADTCATSLTRQATRHILEGIHSLKTAIDTGADLSIPVSADVCDSVASLCTLCPEAKVEIRVEWSPAVRDNIPAISSVILSSAYAAPLRAISGMFKANG